MKSLWSKNFTLITIGTIISMLGNSVMGFAFGLMVFDLTDSTFLYSLVTIAWQLPNFILPLFVGAYLDRFSRKKVIYTLDAISGVLFFVLAICFVMGYFNFYMLLIASIVIGSIGCFYNIAYESFYPTLISEGNYSKAYSISSLIWPLSTTLMVPIAAFTYNNYGVLPILIFNGISFFIASFIETQIKVDETHILENNSIQSISKFKQFKSDMKDGLNYLKFEKGLQTIVIYFTFTMLVSSIIQNLQVPFFSSTEGYNTNQLSIAMSIGAVGRLFGGGIHYLFKYPVKHKFNIAIGVYLSICVLDTIFYFSPFIVMCMCTFMTGILGATSFNIRVSATQSYVPNEKRGRFNGMFAMMTSCGMLIGALISGVCGEIFDYRSIIVCANVFNFILVFVLMVKNRESVKKLYNRNT